MSNLLEVLVTCDCNNTLWSCCVWDPHTGTSLMTYRGGGTAESKTLSFIGHDYLAAVEKAKPVLHIWPLNSHQTVQGMRFILPGKASTFAVSQDGAYCIAGVEEKIYLWQIASGNLLSIINRHYQKIVLLKFTPDGKYFVSAAEDGMVMIWSMVTVAAHPEVELVTQTTAGQFDPIHVLSDHSLPVTDICISNNGIHGRLFTVSSDRTCKIYNLSNGELLLNLVFDSPLLSVTTDVLELNVFVGTAEGKVHQFNLTSPPRNKDFLVNAENVLTFSSHTKGVTCLSTSVDGETLVSGSNDDQVILWHIASRQPVRTIRHKGPITNAYFALNQPSIYKQDFSPNLILHSLGRILDKSSDEIMELEILVNKSNQFWPILNENELDDTNLKLYDIDSKKKEDNLKEELENLKKINANLYAFSVQKVLSNATSAIELKSVCNSPTKPVAMPKKKKNKKHKVKK